MPNQHGAQNCDRKENEKIRNEKVKSSAFIKNTTDVPTQFPLEI